MARRPPETDDDKVISLKDAGFRFRWIERDISDIAKIVQGLQDTAIKNADAIAKINRNVLVLGSVIIGLGIGSKLLDGNVLEILKKILGM